ncbi:unnamed protein product [Thlaspi arvense]|uniref:KIB1-4 beta-propeller domain-containing protein n=1 Tax=Thlaspi arvense TaxID=13288 RepID=A0AAU9RSZ2_THLAR|nr:unnamed protein product [Thlaspi arvense]
MTSYCLASYGNWLFMVDCWYNLYLLNLFTHERIDLPPVESQIGTTKLERTLKDHKLYYLLNDYRGSSGFIKIFDFSGEVPQETFQCGVPGNSSSLDPIRNSWRIAGAQLVVTVTGDVLYVESWARPFTLLWSFRVYKVYSSGFFNKFEQVDSLGNEAILFDLGITVLANDDIVGFKRNSIYFKTTCHEKNTTQICLFNFETQEMEPLHKFDCSSQQQLARALWFLPSFKQT